MNADAAFVHHS